MTDNGIGACADDPLALGDLDGARCIAVLLEHPQDQNIAEKYSSVCKEYQVDRDGIQSMKAQVNGNGYKSSDDDQRDCINDRNLLFVQMSPTLKYLCLQIRALVGQMVQVDEKDLVYKGPWVRSAQQRLFQTLETDYAFPRATCRSLVNLIWDFLNETFSEKLHEGQITFHAASASEPPGKRLSQIKSVPVHLTVHDRNDMDILTKEGTSGLRKHKILRMASEALDQDGLLTQEDLAVLLCSSRRTIRRDIKELKQQGIDVPTRGLIQDIGPGVTHKSKIVKMWLEGYEYTDIERKTGHSGFSIQRYLSGFSKSVRFYLRGYSLPEIRELTDMSERLVKDYLDLYETCKDRPESQIRLQQILAQPLPLKKSSIPWQENNGVMDS